MADTLRTRLNELLMDRKMSMSPASWPERGCEAISEAIAELDRREARELPCTWTEDEDGNCDTGCGHVFTLISDPPHDWVKFCCYCGHPVTVAALKG